MQNKNYPATKNSSPVLGMFVGEIGAVAESFNYSLLGGRREAFSMSRGY